MKKTSLKDLETKDKGKGGSGNPVPPAFSEVKDNKVTIDVKELKKNNIEVRL